MKLLDQINREREREEVCVCGGGKKEWAHTQRERDLYIGHIQARVGQRPAALKYIAFFHTLRRSSAHSSCEPYRLIDFFIVPKSIGTSPPSAMISR